MDIGLKSFEAVTIFAPSILLGLYWKGGNRKGAMAGIVAGFAVWIYTLLIPALMRAGIVEPGGVAGSGLPVAAPEPDGALRPAPASTAGATPCSGACS